ncbi:MAG: glycogen debranching enzyme family protein [Spirochaetales bacterium]|nr:glycogen debranching enzyme family protein [Spirochaetales bacterium]
MKFQFNSLEDASVEYWLSREYLLTNGAGGFACGTLPDCLTRKYHGLLALPDVKSGRINMLLSKIELSMLAGSHQYDLSTNIFPDTVFPEGFRFIRTVEVDRYPTTVFDVNGGNIQLKKSILMPRGAAAVLARYELVAAPKTVTLKLTPFLAYRDAHALTRQNADLRPRTFFEHHGFKIDPYPALPPLFIQTSRRSVFYPSPDWWKNFTYPEERARGYDFSEDLFSPGVFEVKLKPGEAVIVRAGLDTAKPAVLEAAWDREITRLRRAGDAFSRESAPLVDLKLQAEQYVIDSPSGILAGFPWFPNEWGRDALISLPGLLLSRGRFIESFSFLCRIAGYEKDGLLPNTRAPNDDRAYNSLDTVFLFYRAVQRYLAASGDRAGVLKKLVPVMVRMLAAFAEGRSGVGRISEEGFVFGGSEQTQLTWMDAQVKGTPVTPRHGAAVEINALYHNALVFLLEEFGSDLEPKRAAVFSRLRRLFEENFEKRFWNEEDACLYDVYRSPEDRDRSIRPNQLFALGLPACAVSTERARQALETVKLHLVTPYGLRTLSPRDPAFVPEYGGNQDKRDRAYHQGPVWPWLIGIYCDAALQHAEDAETVKKQLKSTFSRLWENHPGDGCIGHVDELFDAVPPHRPGGCPAQAWSLAEVIRVLEMTK